MAEVGEGGKGNIQGQTGNVAWHRGGGARDDGGNNGVGNGDGQKEKNDRGPASEWERKQIRGEVTHRR